jgi:hypothetical protein
VATWVFADEELTRPREFPEISREELSGGRRLRAGIAAQNTQPGCRLGSTHRLAVGFVCTNRADIFTVTHSTPGIRARVRSAPGGAHKDGNGVDQRFSWRTLMIEAGFG